LSRPETPSPKTFFSVHAEDYAKSESHAHGSDLPLLIELLKPQASETALDVAAGTGFTTMELAKHVSHVTALDITEEMLDEARKLALTNHVENISFKIGEAERIPFADASFDIVTTRRAPHHFANVDGFLVEAKRVLAPKGRLGVVDMSPPEGSEEFFNNIERIRDATHTTALTPTEWNDKVTRAGFTIRELRVLPEALAFERWLYPVKMGGVEEMEVRKRVKEVSPSVASLMKITCSNGSLSGWTKNRIVLIARRE
jgi:SAM-dependent methyltransferase